jgi:parallel beta-helix repeat protein
VIGNIAEGDGEMGFGIDSADINIFKGNTSTGGWVGFSVHALSTGNELIGNESVGAFLGIDVFTASDNDVIANTVSWGGFGIKLDAAQNNAVLRNTVTGMGEAGIALIQVPERAPTIGNEVARNTVSDSNWGIAVWGAEANSFLRNRLESFGEAAFSLEQANGNQFLSNELSHGSSGFRVNGSNGNLFSNNTSFGGDDFTLYDSHDNRIVGNTAIGDPGRDVYFGTDGYVLFGSSGNEISRNTAEAQGGAGFRLDDGSWDNDLNRNVSIDNGHSGILLSNSHENTVDRNEVFRNGWYGEDSAGIYVRESTDNVITRNNACDNLLHDATQANSSGTVWERSEFCEPLYFEAPIRVSVSSGSVWGNGFTPDTEVTVEINRGLSLLFSGVEWVNEFGDFWLESSVLPEPGDVVTVSDGTISRELVVAALTFDLFDMAADVMAGTADPGGEVRVGYGNEFEGYDTVVIADGSGNWYLDVSGTFDLTFDTGADAAVYEPDGDATIAWPPPLPQIRANPQGDFVDGFGFSGDTTVSIVITDGTGTPLFSGGAAVDETETHFSVFPEVDIQPGHVVTVTGDDSGVVKTLEVATLTFDVFDVAADVMAGTADPGGDVRVNGGDESGGFELFAVADGSGNWTADLSGEFDLTFDTWTEAAVDDNDGDATIAWPPETP